MGTLLQDLAYALRTLRRAPGFASVTIAVLALGIGANAALFSLVQGILLRPLPWPEPERLVAVWETIERPDLERRSVSYPDFEDWREGTRSFAGLSAVAATSFTLTGDGRAEQVAGEWVSAAYVEILGTAPARGRGLDPDEDAPGARPSVVISDGLWRERFGADPGALSAQIVVDGRPSAIVGIMPPGFGGVTDAARLWVAMGGPLGPSPARLLARSARWHQVVGRLAEGVSLAEARSELDRIAEAIEREHPDQNRNRGAEAVALSEELLGELAPSLTALLGAVGFVLLIACAGVANLSLTRAAGRRRELAVRGALGASRWRLQRQLLTESLLLSLAGGAVGVALANLALGPLLAASPVSLPSYVRIGIDARVLLAAALLSVATGLLSGLAPAWAATRSGLEPALRDGARGSAGPGRLRNGLVVAELALALVLLVGAGLMTRSLAALRSIDSGFEPESLVTLQLALPDRDDGGAAAAAFADALLERVRGLPGVSAAALGSDSPLGEDSSASLVRIAGRDDVTQDDGIRVYRHSVTPGFFEALGVSLLAGRDFGPGDPGRSAESGVAIVSQRFSRRHFPDGSPLGHFVELGRRKLEIVGVVADVGYRGLLEPGDADPDLYVPMAQFPRLRPHLAVRSDVPAGALLESLREAVRELDPGVPLYAASTMRERLDAERANARFASALFAGFALLALALAALGLYAVIGYAVRQRRREIGTRIALGATPGEVVRLVLASGSRLALMGLGLGLLGAVALSRLLGSLLVEVAPTDVATYALTSAALAVVSLVALLVPARRATRVDPIEALRNE